MTEEAFNKVMDELERARSQVQTLQKQLQQALLGKVPEHEVTDPGTIWIEPIVSHRNGEGRVNMRWGHLSAQFNVKEAREHAHGILQAAEAAETDAFLCEFIERTLGATKQQMSVLLQDFRAFRERKRI